jgi:DNA-directed RNA polymerase specialized sigma24 family protein
VAALANCRKIDDADTRAERQAAVVLVHGVLTQLAGRVRVQGSPIPEHDRNDLVNTVLVSILDRDGLKLETSAEAGARSYLARMLQNRRLDGLRKDKPHRHLSIGNPETDDGSVNIDVEMHRLGQHNEQPVPAELGQAAARMKRLSALAKESCGEGAFEELVELRLARDPAALRSLLIAAEQVRTGDDKKARDNVNQRISRARKRLKVAIENDPALETEERHDLLVLVDALRERKASATGPDQSSPDPAQKAGH